MLSGFETYDSYKDSGIDWLGDIPSEWDLLPAMRFLQESKTKNKGMVEDQVLSLSYGNIVKKSSEQLTGLVPESFETYQIVEKGDIIIRGTDLQNDKTSLRTGLSKYRGIITSAYLNLRHKEEVCPKYLHYFFHSMDISKSLYKFGSGLRQNLSFDDFKRMQIPDLGKEQQSVIARFLDDKIEKIDRAIAIKKAQIAKLEEHKQILIQTAVTRGLDANVQMKGSGVDWIGAIPAHWEVKRIKYLLKERNERSDSGKETLFMVSQVHGLVIRSEYHEKASAAADSIDSKIVYEGDLVFNKLKAHLGVFFKSSIKEVGLVSPDYAVYHKTNYIHDLKFFELLFRHPNYIKQFIIRATGIADGLIRLYTEDLFDIKVAFPPLEEQKKILAEIEVSSSKIFNLLTSQKDQIQQLKEYRATLINAAVTGKIKVPS